MFVVIKSEDDSIESMHERNMSQAVNKVTKIKEHTNSLITFEKAERASTERPSEAFRIPQIKLLSDVSRDRR